MQWRCVISITLCIAHSVGWDMSASTASNLSCASWRGCAQLLITWLTNASQWELPHRDLPADPRVGNTHHVGADEQMQMHGGEEVFAEGWKGHILQPVVHCMTVHGSVLVKPPDSYPWIGFGDSQIWVKRKKQETSEVKLLDPMYTAADARVVTQTDRLYVPYMLYTFFWSWSLVNLWTKHLSFSLQS